MRLRVGGGSKARVKTANYFFFQHLETLFPTHLKYILTTASKEMDLFSNQTNYLAKWSKSLLS